MVFSLLRDAWSAFAYHYKEGNMNWPMVIYLILTHMAAWIGVTSIPSCKWQTWLEAFILWPITGLGITAGVHRLWAHRSYNATLPYRFLLMIFNSIANQGPIYHWARDHRVHHKYSETDADPHNATRGFFFAHMGWLLVKKHPKYVLTAFGLLWLGGFDRGTTFPTHPLTPSPPLQHPPHPTGSWRAASSWTSRTWRRTPWWSSRRSTTPGSRSSCASSSPRSWPSTAGGKSVCQPVLSRTCLSLCVLL